jgi:hypothetical protein
MMPHRDNLPDIERAQIHPQRVMGESPRIHKTAPLRHCAPFSAKQAVGTISGASVQGIDVTRKRQFSEYIS